LRANDKTQDPGLPIELLLPVISASRCVIVEGGDACVYRPETFKPPLRLKDLEGLIENLILNRNQMRSPSIFVCLGHQLACNSITKLIARFIDEVRVAHASMTLTRAASGESCPNWLEDLREECLKIESIGNSISIVPEIRGFRHREFTVCANRVTEVGKKVCLPNPLVPFID